MGLKLFDRISRLKQRVLNTPPLDVTPTDCFLVSWPRSGNTWMRYMLFNALHPESQWDLLEIDKRMPMVDRPDLQAVLDETGEQPYRMFKSHDAFKNYMLKGKVAYIIRDGRDALLSYYHYRAQMHKQVVPFSDFVRQAVEGNVGYGAWHDHVESWLKFEDHPNVLVLKYEEMLLAPMEHLKKVLHHFNLNVAQECMEQAVVRSTVDNVNKGFVKYAESRKKQFSGGLGGGSGKWQKTFLQEDIALFNRWCGKTMIRCGYSID